MYSFEYADKGNKRENQIIGMENTNQFLSFLKDNLFKPMQTDKDGKMVLTKYYINPFGEVIWRASNECGYKVKKYLPDKDGYDRSSYDIDGKHMMKRRCILVAQNFIDNPHKYPQINHKNRNILDNRAENLEWVTALQNAKHEKKTRNLRIIKPDYPILQLEDCGFGEYRLIKRYNTKHGLPTYLGKGYKGKLSKNRVLCVCNTDGAYKSYQHCHGFKWIFEKDKDKYNII